MNQFILLLFALKNFTVSAPKEFRNINQKSHIRWKIEKIGRLPETVKESSGLAYSNGKLFTHGDSGNDPALFAVNYPLEANCSVIKIEFKSIANLDWESISLLNKDTIAIADFGNNGNRRDNLKIYFGEIGTGHVYDSLNFIPEDFNSTIPIKEKSYDFEALFSFEKKLYAISKDWNKDYPRLYCINSQQAKVTIVDTLPIKGLVTGADYSADANMLLVTTYTHIYSFYYNEIDGAFKPLYKRKNPFRGQIEAICFINEKEAVFSNENGKLFRISIRDRK